MFMGFDVVFVSLCSLFGCTKLELMWGEYWFRGLDLSWILICLGCLSWEVGSW